MTLRGHVNGDFYDVSVPTGQILMDGFTHVDTSIQWAVNETIDLKLLVNNVLDSGYEESVGFSNPGRQVRLAVSARL